LVSLRRSFAERRLVAGVLDFDGVIADTEPLRQDAPPAAGLTGEHAADFGIGQHRVGHTSRRVWR
jgi:hypothetical protein